jgi:enoyl-CoA hydratase/carnithine racemase
MHRALAPRITGSLSLTPSEIDVERRGRIEIIRMRRPDHGNRVSQQMAEEMAAALRAARQSPDVGACVLTGHGDVFCLGGDYQGAGPTSAGRHAFARAFMDLAQAMARLGKPLIAAVNGNAHAGGFSLVVACDMAVTADDATLGLPEVAKGLFPFLALAIVKDALPKKALFDIVYRARLMDAAEAKGLHLVNEMVARGAVLERAVQIAGEASAHNPAILRLGRDLYYNMRNLNPAQALEESGFALLAALAAEDEARGGKTS